MDTFAHAIWRFIIFYATGNIWLAIFFGIMPDLFSWTIYLFYAIATGKMKKEFRRPDLDALPNWIHVLYGLTHSVFVIALVFVLVFLFTRQIPIYLWAWPLHVLIDIPTHSRKMLPTPFLWPVFDWKFPGFSWGQTWFMALNYIGIVVALIFIFL